MSFLVGIWKWNLIFPKLETLWEPDIWLGLLWENRIRPVIVPNLVNLLPFDFDGNIIYMILIDLQSSKLVIESR